MDCIVHGVARDRHDWATLTLTVECSQDETECIPSLEGLHSSSVVSPVEACPPLFAPAHLNVAFLRLWPFHLLILVLCHFAV